MKTYRNAQMLIDWLGEHQAATVRQMTATGIMNSRDASDAIQYGVRHGVFDKVRQPGASGRAHPTYRWTGQPLPQLKVDLSAPSFDGLLQAWGIAVTPPQLAAKTSRRS